VLVSATGIASLVAAAPLDLTEPFPAEFVLEDLTAAQGGDGTDGTVFNYGSGDYFNYPGRTVSVIGDLNDDGIDDIAISAIELSYVVFGHAGAQPAEFQLPSLHNGDGSAGFEVDEGVTVIAGIRDINGDGIADVVFGDQGQETAYIVFGRDSGFPARFELQGLRPGNGGDGSQGFVLTHTDGSNAGHAVADAGDLNGDGLTDMVIGAPATDPHGRVDAGTVFVVFGRADGFPAEIGLASLYAANGGDGSAGFVMDGIEADGATGNSVNSAGDVNGDGIGDVVFDSASRVFVVFGRSEFPPEVDLSALLPPGGGDGSAGTVLVKLDHGLPFPGYVVLRGGDIAVAGAGDINGDGVGDLIVGDRNYPGNGMGEDWPAGAAFVLFGRREAFPARIDLASLFTANGGDGSHGIVIVGESYEEGEGPVRSAGLGRSVAHAGDVNGDGTDDIVIGAAPNFIHKYCEYSSAYLIFGARGSFAPEIPVNDLFQHNGGDGSVGVLLEGPGGSSQTGWAVSGGGDVNGDGVDDVLIGEPGYGVNCEGHNLHTYLVFGRPIDLDGDGVPANSDDCTLVSNADQRDTNGDGLGNVCDADLNNDCIVNSPDVARMRALLGTNNPNADLDGNGRVGPGDVSILVQSLGERPGPSGLPNACEPDSGVSGAAGERDSG
jgi:hypothetical protein